MGHHPLWVPCLHKETVKEGHRLHVVIIEGDNRAPPVVDNAMITDKANSTSNNGAPPTHYNRAPPVVDDAIITDKAKSTPITGHRPRITQ